MKRMLLGVSRICLVIAMSCAPAWAQATGQISGTARDESGAVLPGVTVTATQTDTGIARTTVTNASGVYALPNLPLGPYRVEAMLQGFGTFARGVVLEVNSSVTIDPLLPLGQVAESVEVQASAPLVETRSATVGAVMQSEQIAELPLNGRNVNDLITLAGGAVSAGEARSEDFVGASSPMIGVAGSAGYGVGYTLDGANHTTFVTGSAMVMPFPDATQEFKVETSGVTAERERSAAVSVVTKSGTNQLRGTLFEFFRNDLFNATNFFAAVDPQTGEKEQSTLKRNQFGGVIGGPIVRNRVFFLGGYQGTLRRQDPQSIRAFVPTAAVLAGDWTQVTSPACNNGRQITLRAPFVNNRINPALYSRAALGVVTWKGPTLPFPTTDDPCGEITYGDMSTDQEGLYVGKVDYQQSNAHALFGRALVQRYNLSNPEEFNTHLLQNTGYRNTNQGSYTLGSTYVINASTVHSFRFAYNKTAVHFDNLGPGVLPTWCDLGVNLYCAPEVTRIQNMTVSGAFNVHSSQLTGHRYAGDSFSINDDLTLVRGAHQLAFGGSIMRGTDDSAFIFASPHQFRFTGGQTGLGMADFLLGRPTTFLTGITNPLFQQETDFSVYANDVWRATPVLTLNAGVRWDPYLPPYTDAIYNFDLERFRQGITSSVFVNAPAGIYYRGDPGFPENGVNPRWWQFAPRVGLAWDVSGDGTMSVRTSYARGYLQIPGNYRQGYAGSSPWGARLTIVNPSGGLDDPFAGIQGANIFPYELDQHAPFPPAGLFFTQPYDLKQPTTQSWSLAVQRELGWRTAVSASYLGSNIRHAWMNKALDPAIVFPGVADANGLCQAEGYTLRTTPGATCSTAQNTSARRKLTLERPEDGNKIGFLAEADDTGTQDYHGLLLSLDRRSVDGVSVNANYTWSRCEDTYQTLYSAMGAHPGDTYADPNDPDLDRGSCTTDRPHVFNLTVVAETPQFANPTLRMVGSGWRVSGIYRASSGQPLTIYAGSDRALNGSQVSNTTVLQRADQVLPDPYEDSSGRPGTRFLNPAAFALPALGTLGNSGRNSIRGPRLVSFDMAVSRVFPVFEGQRLEFRVEAFNVTNSFRPANPSTDVGAPNTFGLIRDALDPRILQFALKYVF